MSNNKNLLEYANLFLERKRLQYIVNPHLKNLERCNSEIIQWGNNLSFKEREFISNKILENFSEYHLKQIYERRERTKQMFENNASFYQVENIFDPLYDDWYVFDIEINKGLVRIEVSCNKNTGHISGIYTIPDLYKSKWFRIEELNTIYE